MANQKAGQLVESLARQILPIIRDETKMRVFSHNGCKIAKRRFRSLSPDNRVMILSAYVAENGKKNGATTPVQIMKSLNRKWPDLSKKPERCMSDLITYIIVARAWDIARKRGGNGKKKY